MILSNRSIIESKGIAKVIPLDLSLQEKGNCLTTRFQTRRVKSIRLGEITLKCEIGKTAEGRNILPSDLKSLVPSANNFAYDTILQVTEMRFRLLMQREEIQQNIALTSGFHISTGSISNLSWIGLASLELCHFSQAKKLEKRYRKKCFFIHLDGTNEGGKYNHFVVREGMSGNVLYAEKIVSESEDSIAPILKKVKELFADPEAIISDMSPAIKKAVNQVFRDVPHRLCHFHFLKDIGKDMLQALHQPLKYSVKNLQKQLKEFRNELDIQRLQINSGKSLKLTQLCECYSWLISIIDRINDYENDLSAEGFPFDLSYLSFFERCQELHNTMNMMFIDMHKSGTLKKNDRNISTKLCLMNNAIQTFLTRLKGVISQLNKVNTIFLELRDILHPKTEKDRIPLNWGMLDDQSKVENIGQKLDELKEKAEKKAKTNALPKYEKKAWKIIYKHLEKYGKHLNPEIQVKGRTVLLPRTNNLSETGFRDVKRKARRTIGKKNLSKYMDELPSQYFYITNLEDANYVKIVYGDREIYDSFPQIDRQQIKKTIDTMKTQRRSPKAIDYKLIRNDHYLELLVKQFSNQDPTTKIAS